MKKKLLMITGSLELGGIERLVRDLSLALTKSGDWDVSVCCLIGRKGAFVNDLEEMGVKVFECPLNKNNIYSFPLRFSKLIKMVKPDLIHSHVNFSIFWQVLGMKLGGVSRIVFTQHNEYPSWKKTIFSRVRIWAYFLVTWHWISAYTTVSDGVRKNISSLSKRSVDDFQVIYNPVDLSTFFPDLTLREKARSEWQINKDQFVIGNVARFAEQKGHIYLIQAAKIVLEKCPGCRFVLVGDGPLRQEIETQIHQLGLDDSFLILGHRNDINSLLNGFDVFTLPSLREGFPISLLEAMACSLPIVATNLSGIQEALQAGSGLVVPCRDPGALAQAILTLREKPELANSLSKNALEHVIQNFSLKEICNKYIALYGTVMFSE